MPAKRFHVRQAAVSALRAWAKGHDYAETLVERHAQRRQLSSADRGLLNAILLGVLRNRRLLDFWIGKLRQGKLDHETRDVLRVGLCQILLLGIPDHAAVHETVESAKAPVRGLVNAVLRAAIQKRQQLLESAEEQSPSIRFSHPDWLVNRWKSAFGKSDMLKLLEWNNSAAPTYFRLNPLRAKESSIPEGSTPMEQAPGFYKLDGPIPIEQLAKGEIYIQDPATRHAVDLLAPKPGERVLDACAAPGGKAFLIAAACGGAEHLTCSDSNEKRLPRLRENLERLGCGGSEIVVHDWSQPAPADFIGAFDAILLDVPCSNTGVFPRRVDVRWRLQAPDIEDLVELQRKILENALPCLKPGGRLVYSTCSIEEEENDGQVKRFIADHPELILIESRRALPWDDHTDGSFAALLQLR